MSDLNSYLMYSPVAELVKHPSTLQRGLLFLWRLAWKSRLRLPYLIVIGFMILDLRVTLEVIVDVPPDDDDEDDDIEDDGDETGTEFSPDEDSFDSHHGRMSI